MRIPAPLLSLPLGHLLYTESVRLKNEVGVGGQEYRCRRPPPSPPPTIHPAHMTISLLSSSVVVLGYQGFRGSQVSLMFLPLGMGQVAPLRRERRHATEGKEGRTGTCRPTITAA